MAKTVKPQETGVTLTSQYTQSDIPSLIENVNQRIIALEGDKENAPKADVELDNFGKVSQITDVNTLRAAYAYVDHKEKAVKEFDAIFKAAAPAIKLPALKEGGCSSEEIKKVIIQRYKDISFKEELDKLKTIKQKLTDNLSAEMKLAETLKDISNMLVD